MSKKNPFAFCLSLVPDISAARTAIKKIAVDANCPITTDFSENISDTTLKANSRGTNALKWNFTGAKIKKKWKKYSISSANKTTT